jgi:hypothetical protein
MFSARQSRDERAICVEPRTGSKVAAYEEGVLVAVFQLK